MLIEDKAFDPMGLALRDYYQKGDSAWIHVWSDIAVNDLIPVPYMFRELDEMPEWERRALDECYGHVLDIGAGAGAHSLELMKRGNQVTALDISPGAVEVMELRGVREVYHADIFSFHGKTYDTLLLMMNGIGIVGDLKGLNKFLQHAQKLLRPGGQILLDSSDLVYMYEHDDVSSPEDRYYGIIQYQMTYEKVQSKPFFWLYVDFPRLLKHAAYYGYRCECLKKGDHYEYLARLTLT